jgi:hypothetical protein
VSNSHAPERSVCLVTSTHISANPRLLKEADALHQAGYKVYVVAIDVNERLRRMDRPILAAAGWNYSLVKRGPFLTYIARSLLQRCSRGLLRRLGWQNLLLASMAHHRLIARLKHRTKQIPAQLYLAHNLAALPAAAGAARKNQSKLGFDAEDFHTEELTSLQRNAGDQIAREIIERILLPRCDHLTAASPLIADAYLKK